ncbi:MAG: hypothetical protein ACI8TQ_003198 [Planctomycetota bacterium]|jgi:hypothetical protein
MKTRLSLSLAILVGFALNPIGTRMEYGPAEGLKLTKSFTGEFTVVLDALDVTMNGEPFPVGIDDADPSDLEGMLSYSVELEEQVNSVSDGRVTDLTRTYSTVSGEVEGGGQSESSSMDELEGQAVRFVWDDETESYTRSLVDEDAEVEEKLLNSLDVEVDVLRLLPSGDIAVGDTWEVPAEAIGGLMIPGIDFVGARERNAEKMDEIPAEFMELFATIQESLEDATIECKFSELSGEGADEVATITFTLAADLPLEIGDMVANQLADQEMPMEMEVDEFTIEFALELQGELVWNVQGGHFSSYEIGGEIGLDGYVTVSAGGGQMEMEGEAEASVEFNVSGSATVN